MLTSDPYVAANRNSSFVSLTCNYRINMMAIKESVATNSNNGYICLYMFMYLYIYILFAMTGTIKNDSNSGKCFILNAIYIYLECYNAVTIYIYIH